MPANREDWLARAVQKIEAYVFRPLELKMPEKWCITCGWAKGASTRAIGVCIDPVCAKDGTTHLFIMPTQDQPFRILGTITHEMIHAIVGVKEQHKGRFKDVVAMLQFSKPLTQSAPVEGTPVYAALEAIMAELGPYPHAAVVPRPKPSKPPQWVRWKSTVEESYTVLANTKKVAKYGMPRDPWGKEMMPVDPEKIFTAKPDPRQHELFHDDQDSDG